MNSSKLKLFVYQPQVINDVVICTYSFDNDGTTYQHTLRFPDVLTHDFYTHKLAQWLAITNAMYLFSIEYPTELICDFSLNNYEISFFENLIYLGMAEFRFVNGIKITQKTKIIPNKEHNLPISADSKDILLPGILLLNGGGKDGAVAGLILQNGGIDFSWCLLNTSVAQLNIVKNMPHKSVVIKRMLDQTRKSGQYSGHRPTSASIAFSALLAGYASNHGTILAANEASANDPNVTIEGVVINHQYSKSLEFEKDLKTLLQNFTVPLRYFSLLRPMHELQIMRIANTLPDKVLSTLISCNHGFKTGVWCLSCAKCAFVVLAATAIDEDLPIKIWGSHVINESKLFTYLKDLINPDTAKPFECVGTIYECHQAGYIILQRGTPVLSPSLKTLLEQYCHNSDNIQLHTFSKEHILPEDFQRIVWQYEKLQNKKL